MNVQLTVIYLTWGEFESSEGLTYWASLYGSGKREDEEGRFGYPVTRFKLEPDCGKNPVDFAHEIKDLVSGSPMLIEFITKPRIEPGGSIEVVITDIARVLMGLEEF